MENCKEQNVIKSLTEKKNILETIQQFNKTHKQIFKLDPNFTDDRQKMIDLLLLELYKNGELNFLHETLKIILYTSRDKNVVDRFYSNKKFVDFMLKHVCLCTAIEDVTKKSMQCLIEVNACKVLCNVVYLTRDSQGVCCNSEFLSNIMRNINSYSRKTHEQNVTSLRCIFLVTALNQRGRNILIDEHDARTVVLQYLQFVVDKNLDPNNKRALKDLSDEDSNMLCEVLKVVFNLNMDLRRVSIHNQKETEDMGRTVKLCSLILSSETQDPKLTEPLHCNAGNALYSIPPHCFNMELFIPSLAGADDKGNFQPVIALLNILKHRIMNSLVTVDVMQPLLALMSQLSRISRDIRKFYKNEIIPPRKDFKNRPEDGKTFRNKLIKLFTYNDTEVKSAAADFIFVLCKENVDRFVKYTGYGNAAGLLAARGLLAGGMEYEANYSDDTDSDTEEYKEISEQINPVTGHIPPVVKNPMEGMSDEQKEYLAVQLATQIQKLSSHDVMQPMCVGEDGRLVSLHQKLHETKNIESSEQSSDSD